MMGNEQEAGEGEAHLYASREEMENLILDDDSSNSHPLSNGDQPTTSTHTITASPPSADPLTALPEIATTSSEPSSPKNKKSNFNLSPRSPTFPRSFQSPNPNYTAVNPSASSSFNNFLASSSSPPSMPLLVDENTPDTANHISIEEEGGSESDYIHITVSDPHKVPEITSNSIVPGSNSYYTYLITTKTNFPEYKTTEISVHRRFRELVTLSDRLAESFRGFFIPLRPDKGVVDRQVMQKYEFVEQRKLAIEKYLRKLAAHPVIRRSDELRVFLQVQGKLPLPKSIDVASRMLDGAVKLPKQLMGDVTVTPEEVVQPAKGGRDLMRLFKELKQSVTNDWGGAKPSIVEEDKGFLEKKERLQELEQQLSNVSKQAEELVRSQQDTGDTMAELGMAFIKLTKFELEEAVCESQRVRAGDMKHVATATVKASRLHRELNAQIVKHLDKLHEYLGMMLAADNAFADRSSALLTVQTLLSDVSSLQSRIDKLEVSSSKIFGGDRSRIQKMEELKVTLRATEDAKCIAVREYERIKENNWSELERLDKERCADFVSMLKGFVENQAGYAEKMAGVWEKVAEETRSYAFDV